MLRQKLQLVLIHRKLNIHIQLNANLISTGKRNILNATWSEQNFLSQAKDEQKRRIIFFTHVSIHYWQRLTGSQSDYLPTVVLQAISSDDIQNWD